MFLLYNVFPFHKTQPDSSDWNESDCVSSYQGGVAVILRQQDARLLFFPYIKCTLFEVCNSWLEQFHILLSVDVHCYGFTTTLTVGHLAKYSSVRTGDFRSKRNLCFSILMLIHAQRVQMVDANLFAGNHLLFWGQGCTRSRMDKQSIP